MQGISLWSLLGFDPYARSSVSSCRKHAAPRPRLAAGPTGSPRPRRGGEGPGRGGSGPAPPGGHVAAPAAGGGECGDGCGRGQSGGGCGRGVLGGAGCVARVCGATRCAARALLGCRAAGWWLTVRSFIRSFVLLIYTRAQRDKRVRFCRVKGGK